MYAAVDFVRQIDIHCGAVVWHQQQDGAFRVVAEQNFIDKEMERKLQPSQLASIRAQFGC